MWSTRKQAIPNRSLHLHQPWPSTRDKNLADQLPTPVCTRQVIDGLVACNSRLAYSSLVALLQSLPGHPSFFFNHVCLVQHIGCFDEVGMGACVCIADGYDEIDQANLSRRRRIQPLQNTLQRGVRAKKKAGERSQAYLPLTTPWLLASLAQQT